MQQRHRLNILWLAQAQLPPIVVLQPAVTKEKAMLVLSRREGETVLIDEEITVTVLEVHSNFVRIGIDAPVHIKILREELKEEKVDEAV